MNRVVIVLGERHGTSLLLELAAYAARLRGDSVIVVRAEPDPGERLVGVDDEFGRIEERLIAVVDEAARFEALNLALTPVVSQVAVDGRPRSRPWWDLHDVPEAIETAFRRERQDPAYRAALRPGLSGKRTRASQKLHNRRAA